MVQYSQRPVTGVVMGAAVILAMTTAVAARQKPAPADVAAKLSGSWKLNRELSPSVAPPARGRTGGPGRSGEARMTLAAGLAFAGQRGGGGGRGGGGATSPTTPADLPPDVIAAQAAMRDLQQIAETITVKATADAIALLDPRGEWTFAIDNKAAKLEINGAKVEVKSKWDKLAVRQEFATVQTRLVRTWEVDDQDHLVLKIRIESMTMSSKEAKAVYDRQ
jgi:hypothetical protein